MLETFHSAFYPAISIGRMSPGICRLQSPDTLRCVVPVTMTQLGDETRLGDRSFAVASPSIWTKLSAPLWSQGNYAHFNWLLKAHMFDLGSVTFLFVGLFTNILPHSFTTTTTATITRTATTLTINEVTDRRRQHAAAVHTWSHNDVEPAWAELPAPYVVVHQPPPHCWTPLMTHRQPVHHSHHQHQHHHHHQHQCHRQKHCKAEMQLIRRWTTCQHTHFTINLCLLNIIFQIVINNTFIIDTHLRKLCTCNCFL